MLAHMYRAETSSQSEPKLASQVTEKCPHILKLPQEVLDKIAACIPDDISTIRLVCKDFHQCCWPGLANKLTLKKLDLRSKSSMTFLDEISKDGRLAPYVKSLTFCSCFVTVDWPNQGAAFPDIIRKKNMCSAESISAEKLGSESVEKLEKYAKGPVPPEEKPGSDRKYEFWHHNAWKWPPNQETHESGKKLVDDLTLILERFTQLASVEFLNHTPYPADFLDIFKDINEAAAQLEPPLELDHPRFHHPADHVGLDFLLQALAATELKINQLMIPVAIIDWHTLVTYGSAEPLRKILKHVKDLFITSPVDIALPSEPAYFVEDSEILRDPCIAPNVSKLLWYHWTPDRDIEMLSRHNQQMTLNTPTYPDGKPPYPQLRDLHLRSKFPWLPARNFPDQKFRDFLIVSKNTLRTLRLSVNPGIDWPELVRFLAEKDEMMLEELTIEEHWNQMATMEMEEITIPTKEEFDRAAGKVFLGPAQFKAWVKQHYGQVVLRKDYPRTPFARDYITSEI
jgi:hypothetical protein